MATARKKSEIISNIELPAYGSSNADGGARRGSRKQSVKSLASGIREEDVSENVDSLKRSLTNRQLQLIAIGGSIGTALFVSIGKLCLSQNSSVMLSNEVLIRVLHSMGIGLGRSWLSFLGLHTLQLLDGTCEQLYGGNGGVYAC